jgi:hypothetical protein
MEGYKNCGRRHTGAPCPAMRRGLRHAQELDSATISECLLDTNPDITTISLRSLRGTKSQPYLTSCACMTSGADIARILPPAIQLSFRNQQCPLALLAFTFSRTHSLRDISSINSLTVSRIRDDGNSLGLKDLGQSTMQSQTRDTSVPPYFPGWPFDRCPKLPSTE